MTVTMYTQNKDGRHQRFVNLGSWHNSIDRSFWLYQAHWDLSKVFENLMSREQDCQEWSYKQIHFYAQMYCQAYRRHHKKIPKRMQKYARAIYKVLDKVERNHQTLVIG